MKLSKTVKFDNKEIINSIESEVELSEDFLKDFEIFAAQANTLFNKAFKKELDEEKKSKKK